MIVKIMPITHSCITIFELIIVIKDISRVTRNLNEKLLWFIFEKLFQLKIS